MILILKNFSRSILHGLGQIMLQENNITGVLFLFGIFIGSFEMGIAALIATIAGTATALLMKYDTQSILKGIYGFSPALVGVACILFLNSEFLTWLMIIIGASLAAILQHYFKERKIAVFTLPFVLVTWLIYFSMKLIYPELLREMHALIPSSTDKFLFPVKGFGQVIFQANIWSGVLFIAGVFLSSRIAGFYALLAALLAGIISLPFTPVETISNGLMSYNAVLCAIVFSGKAFKNIIYAGIAIILSVIFTLIMMKYQMMALTFPFVLSSILTLRLSKRKEQD